MLTRLHWERLVLKYKAVNRPNYNGEQRAGRQSNINTDSWEAGVFLQSVGLKQLVLPTPGLTLGWP